MGGHRRAGIILCTVTMGLLPSQARAATKYRTCTQVNAVYPYGVAKRGAVDKVTGGPRATGFTINSALYATLPKALDPDRDGIACERPTPVTATSTNLTAALPIVATPAPVVEVQTLPAVTAAPVTAAPAPAPTAAPATAAPPPPAPVTTPSSVVAAARTYANCSDLNLVYPHGVGRTGAIDATSGSAPVTTFTIDDAVYAANRGSDRDGDGIACEKK